MSNCESGPAGVLLRQYRAVMVIVIACGARGDMAIIAGTRFGKISQNYFNS